MSISLPFAFFASLFVGLFGPGEGEHGSSRDLPPSITTRMDCAVCHPMTPALSHPVGITVPRSSGLPPGAGGTLDCMTCHAVPASKVQHLTDGKGAETRLPSASLCSACHSRGAKPGSALAHGLILGRAHLSSAGGAEFPAAGLDTESRSCLSCHDGSAASSAKVRLGGQPMAVARRGGGWRAEHPIGVRYGALREPPLAPQYRPRSNLPASIRLFGSKLGCGSCHSVYAGIDGMRAVSEQSGGLCQSCHLK